MSDLTWARSVITSSATREDQEKGIQILADATANPDLRPQLRQDGDFLLQVLGFFNSLREYNTEHDPSDFVLYNNTLRCVGNLVADNDTGRQLLLDEQTPLTKLGLCLQSRSPDPEARTLAQTAIKVLYNLCNAYPPAQKTCFEMSLHQTLIFFLDAHPPTDDAVSSLALDLIAMLVEQKRELKLSEPEDGYTSLALPLFGLPLANVDATAFLDALTVVTVYLLEEKFVQATVEVGLIDRVWLVLQRTESRLQSDREVEDEEDYDEKQYLQFQLILSQSLADMSSLPLFNEKYHVSDPFIKSLIPQTVPLSTDPKHRSPLPPAACLILGNLITSDEVAKSLIPHMPLQVIFSHLGRSNDTAYLNAASGLLRHLATPLANREMYFADTEYVRLTQHLYTDITMEQVQSGGLALAKQMISGMKSRIVTLLSDASENFLSTLLSTYQTTTSTAVKLEVSRLMVAIFRTLQASMTTDRADTGGKDVTEILFDTPVNLPSALEPLLFSIKHAPEPGIVAIQAEAWLGLNLASRLSGGAEKVSAALAEDSELLSLLTTRLDGGGTADDNRPTWLKEKERDNTFLLCAELLKAEHVDNNLKEKLRGLLHERNINVD